jgi:glycine oxidase
MCQNFDGRSPLNHVAVVGAGIVGKVVALELRKKGLQVTIFERSSDRKVRSSTSYYAGGMLAPFSEVDLLPPGVQPYLSEIHDAAHGFYTNLSLLEADGGLVLAHPLDEPLYEEFKQKVGRLAGSNHFRKVNSREMAELEPSLTHRFKEALYFEGEGHLDPRLALRRLDEELDQKGVRTIFGAEAEVQAPSKLRFQGEIQTYDLVVDCRGMAAQDEIQSLRGVKGEALIVNAPEVNLRRGIRILHPRYPLYVVPRQDGVYYVGATLIERDGKEEMTVRSALELMSALIAVCPAFAEARILELIAERRPALPHNEPRIFMEGGVARINGLYRSGFLMAPWIARIFVSAVTSQLEEKHAAFLA